MEERSDHSQRSDESSVLKWTVERRRGAPRARRSDYDLPRSGLVQSAFTMGRNPQLGLLRLLAGDIRAAADLLSQAPGLGWSSEEHPGHVLFPSFALLLVSRV